MRKFVMALLLAGMARPAFGQAAIAHIYADQKNQIHIAYKEGETAVVKGERGQLGIDSAQISPDGKSAGWLALYKDPDNSSPFAGTLVLFRGGKVWRRFGADQTFWSWAFYAGGTQVAYHVGPTHGETQSHCELHDAQSGRLLASWDGDLDDSNRPAWVKSLDH